MTSDRPTLAHTTAKLLMTAWFLGLPVALAGPRVEPGQGTALDRYVAAADDSYAYSLLHHTADHPGADVYVLEMTSQTWQPPGDVDRTVWKHALRIVCPAQVRHPTGLLFIGGGSNSRPIEPGIDDHLVEIALATGSVVAELGMVPNQPLAFADGQPRHEDSLIAYTWDQFLRSGDPLWLARLPMTKSAVRAMDTITDFCAREETGAHKVESFVVAGGSKRGWTTWTTAAVDDRVVAAVPIVIDLLNIVPSFRHHYRVYGRFAPAVDDYVEFGVMDWMGTPEFAALLRVVGPYQYRNRFTMPKFLINACGDQFFVPDSWQFYLRALPAETMVRYVPNADHGLGGSDAVQSLGAFYHAILNGIPRPEFEWQVQADGSIRVETATQPLTVRLWQATNPEGRDFREDTIGDAWSATDLEPDEPGVYVAQVPEPETGWTAFMVELRYDSGCPYPFTFTTGVSVTPNTYPYPAYEPKPRE